MFEEFLIKPLYNGFVYLIGVMPEGEVGLAIIVLTLIVRAVFYPAFAASIRTQLAMAAIQPELDEINRTYKDNREERARRTMALFKEKKVRPLAGLLSLLVQIPIFIALYFVFFKEGLPTIDTTLLYSFVTVPTMVQTDFFGLINLLAVHNVALAALVGGTQYLLTNLSLARTPNRAASPEQEMAHKLQRGLMLYMLPILMTGFTFAFPAGVGLYFLTGNLISIAQEVYIKRKNHFT